MLYVSIFVELLRSRPALAVWLGALAQALLWMLVPTLFYAAPPGDVPTVLAVGHEFQLGTHLGPPLAFWLAELVYDLSGNNLAALYALSQICVVVTYWAVFALARSIVGAQHAALAVLLMVGIAAFTVPTPDFGPVILTMPLWAIILLHYWRAVGEGRRSYWLALAIEIGLLLLTTYVGLILVGLLLLFTVANKRARAAMSEVQASLPQGIRLTVASDSSEDLVKQLNDLLLYMDGKDGAQDLLDKVLKDPALLQALSAAKSEEQGKAEESPTPEGQPE